jgi:Ca2+:H+ antiporter
VTVIEVGLIVTLMISGGPAAASLARDTVFAALMIVCLAVLPVTAGAGGARGRGRRYARQLSWPSFGASFAE